MRDEESMWQAEFNAGGPMLVMIYELQKIRATHGTVTWGRLCRVLFL